MRLRHPILALLLLALTAPVLRAQDAAAIQRLEAARDADPKNVAALRSLGIAYFKAERFEDASTVLEQARQLDADDGLIALYAGLSAEKVPDYTRARAAYNDYLNQKRPWYAFKAKRTATQVRNRLVAIAREESVAAAKAAVANEAQLAATPGNPRTVAVPPMRFTGPDAEQLAPLERGLAELVITDLSKSSQLTVVERDRMQALADEIQLGESGRVDSSTAVRAGRLIQAGRLVNGAIIQGGQQLTLSSSVVDVNTSEFSAPVQVTDGMDQFFTMQKQLVFRIFDQLGVTLTPAERQAIDERQTNNFDAFLLYSRGLQAADQGRFEDASRFFEQARSLDPAFRAAATQASVATAAAAGSEVTATTLESTLPRAQTTVIASAVAGTVTPAAAPRGLIPGLPRLPRLPATPPGPIGGTLTLTLQNVNPPSISPITNAVTTTLQPAAPNIDPPSSGTGTDRVNVVEGTVVIIIRRP